MDPSNIPRKAITKKSKNNNSRKGAKVKEDGLYIYYLLLTSGPAGAKGAIMTWRRWPLCHPPLARIGTLRRHPLSRTK
jgi:hypothetical protein